MEQAFGGGLVAEVGSEDMRACAETAAALLLGDA
jgi:hypothetical protein